MKWSVLQKSVSKFTTNKFYEIDSSGATTPGIKTLSIIKNATPSIVTLGIMALCIMTLSIMTLCLVTSSIIMSVVFVILLSSVIILSVVLLNVVAPLQLLLGI